MSAPGNTLQRKNSVATSLDVCRDDSCERLDIHPPNVGCLRRRGHEALFRTRSRRFESEPWRAYNGDGLRESALAATSKVEPRTFSMVLSAVENDYGSCCVRSLHRHLNTLRDHNQITFMVFPAHRVRAYLRAGSRLVNDPDLVLEQILDRLAERHDLSTPRARCGMASA